MAIKKSSYSILVDVDLNVKSIKDQLKDAQKEIKPLKIEGLGKASKDFKEISKSARETSDAVEDVSLTFQAANKVFSDAVDVIASMVEEVYKLDAATIEFQKVSDLSGEALDKYISKLTEMGGAVARTGKPKCQAPNVGMINQH